MVDDMLKLTVDAIFAQPNPGDETSRTDKPIHGYNQNPYKTAFPLSHLTNSSNLWYNYSN